MEQNQFRIGGVYRDGQGRVVKLIPYSLRDDWAIVIPEEDGGFKDTPGWGDGARRLSDGRYVHDHHHVRDGIALIPGELTLVDGKWIARGVEEKAAKELACAEAELAEMREHGDIEDVLAASANLERVRLTNAAMVNRDSRPRKPLLGQRPAWFDPFPGFTAKSHTPDQPKQSLHNLQKACDFDGLAMKG